MSKALIQSHVRHGDKWFYVSTINRESSAVASYGATYAETIAWEFEPASKQRGDIVAQVSATTDSLSGHFKVCKALFEGGEL
jgi:hypothetical protein